MVRAYSGDQSDGTNAAVAKDYFLSALEDSDLELKVRDKEPATLDEACKMAQRLEMNKQTIAARAASAKNQHVRSSYQQIRDNENSSAYQFRSTRTEEGGKRPTRSSDYYEHATQAGYDEMRALIDRMDRQMQDLLKKRDEDEKAAGRQRCLDATQDFYKTDAGRQREKSDLASSSQPGRRTHEGPGPCYKCGGGHLQRNCPQNRKCKGNENEAATT
jgi:hypothetical protein